MARWAAGVAASLLALLAAAPPAAAHVLIIPPVAEAGTIATVTLQVPNEEPGAVTTQVEILFPAEYGITQVSLTPQGSWQLEVERQATLAPNGERVEAVVRARLFGDAVDRSFPTDFELAIGPLPSGVGELVLPVVQTYDSGLVVRWSERPTPDRPDPPYPAPVLRLRPGSNPAPGRDPAGSPVQAGGGRPWLLAGGLGMLALLGGLVGLRRAAARHRASS